MRYVWLDEKKEAIIVEREGKVCAYSSLCPHMGAQLVYDAKEDKLVCPWHGLSFDLKTGESNHHRYKKVHEFCINQNGVENADVEESK